MGIGKKSRTTKGYQEKASDKGGKNRWIGAAVGVVPCADPVPRADPVQTCGTRHTGYSATGIRNDPYDSKVYVSIQNTISR